MLRTGNSRVTCVLSAFELIILLYVRKNGKDYAESVRCCHTKYICPGKQVARICAPLVGNV